MRTMIVVGAGAAGASAALALRSAGFDGRLLLIGAEPTEPYRRPPLSKDVLRGTMSPEKIRLKPSQTWHQQGIELLIGTTVTDLDPAAKTITLDDGSRLGYDRLLLATGGRARTLPQAAGLSGVHTLRTLADLPALRADLAPGRRVLVVGAGLIGAEVASTARALGCAVTVLEAGPVPLGRLLPPRLARVYTELHRSRGVRLHTGVTLEQLERHGDALVATTGTGRFRGRRRWAADAVVVAVGMAPQTELAERAGLVVEDGIVVDECCATSAPDVFAAGDVANQPNLILGGRQRIEHWHNAQEQGAAAARSMLGERRPFAPVPWCWSDQHGVNLQVCGWPAAGDELRIRGDLDALAFTAIFRRDGRLTGAVGINRAAEIRALRRLVAEAPYTDPGLLADVSTDLSQVMAAVPGHA